MQLKFHSERAAIAAAREIPGFVQIIESNDDFFLEDEEEPGMIRNWERLVYSGPGVEAKAS